MGVPGSRRAALSGRRGTKGAPLLPFFVSQDDNGTWFLFFFWYDSWGIYNTTWPYVANLGFPWHHWKLGVSCQYFDLHFIVIGFSHCPNSTWFCAIVNGAVYPRDHQYENDSFLPVFWVAFYNYRFYSLSKSTWFCAVVNEEVYPCYCQYFFSDK